MTTDSIPGLEKILFTEEQIEARIRKLAAEISRDYEGKTLREHFNLAPVPPPSAARRALAGE